MSYMTVGGRRTKVYEATVDPKDETRVLCGHPKCGGEIARRVRCECTMIEIGEDYPGYKHWSLQIPAGLVRHDHGGVMIWEPTQRNRRRIQQGIDSPRWRGAGAAATKPSVVGDVLAAVRHVTGSRVKDGMPHCSAISLVDYDTVDYLPHPFDEPVATLRGRRSTLGEKHQEVMERFRRKLHMSPILDPLVDQANGIHLVLARDHLFHKHIVENGPILADDDGSERCELG